MPLRRKYAYAAHGPADADPRPSAGPCFKSAGESADTSAASPSVRQGAGLFEARPTQQQQHEDVDQQDCCGRDTENKQPRLSCTNCCHNALLDTPHKPSDIWSPETVSLFGLQRHYNRDENARWVRAASPSVSRFGVWAGKTRSSD